MARHLFKSICCRRAWPRQGYVLNSDLWPRTRSEGPEEDPEIPEKDPANELAEFAEEILIELKRRRRISFWAIVEKYLRRRTDIIGADAQHCSVREYLRRVDAGVRFVANRLKN